MGFIFFLIVLIISFKIGKKAKPVSISSNDGIGFHDKRSFVSTVGILIGIFGMLICIPPQVVEFIINRFN